MKKVFFTFVITCIIGLPANADPAKTSAGKEIFNGKGMCAGCHVLKDAGSVGTIGPSLDQLKLNISIVTATVTEGKGFMPAFGKSGMLTKVEIDSVAFYVANSAGK